MLFRLFQATALTLSQPVASVVSWMLAMEDRTSACRIVAASSKSLIVIVPPGFSNVCNWDVMQSGKAQLQTVGGMKGVFLDGRIGGSQTPPRPSPEASQVPWKAGLDGTISAMRVGRDARSVAYSSRSSSWSRTAAVIWMTPELCACDMACCNWEKRPWEPGIPMAMLRSSPNSF